MAKPTIQELEQILNSDDSKVEVGPDGSLISSEFRMDLTALLNKHSKESGSHTPDFILARYLLFSLYAFDIATCDREQWYGRLPIE